MPGNTWARGGVLLGKGAPQAWSVGPDTQKCQITRRATWPPPARRLSLNSFKLNVLLQKVTLERLLFGTSALQRCKFYWVYAHSHVKVFLPNQTGIPMGQASTIRSGYHLKQRTHFSLQGAGRTCHLSLPPCPGPWPHTFSQEWTHPASLRVPRGAGEGNVTTSLTFMMLCARYILDTQRWSLDQQHRITWKLVRNGGSRAPPRH